MSNTIYIINNDINHKVYIGQTTRTLYDRWMQHKRDSKKINTRLYRAIRKYGLTHFNMIPICSSINKETLNDLEIQFIKEYDSFHNGYNMTIGGNISSGMLGKTHTKSSIEIMIIKHKGKNNYRFSGYYHTPFGILESYRDIKKHTNNISASTIRRWCKHPDKVIKQINISFSKYLTKDMIGHTFRDIGFFHKSI